MFKIYTRIFPGKISRAFEKELGIATFYKRKAKQNRKLFGFLCLKRTERAKG